MLNIRDITSIMPTPSLLAHCADSASISPPPLPPTPSRVGAPLSCQSAPPPLHSGASSRPGAAPTCLPVCMSVCLCALQHSAVLRKDNDVLNGAIGAKSGPLQSPLSMDQTCGAGWRARMARNSAAVSMRGGISRLTRCANQASIGGLGVMWIARCE